MTVGVTVRSKIGLFLLTRAIREREQLPIESEILLGLEHYKPNRTQVSCHLIFLLKTNPQFVIVLHPYQKYLHQR